MLLSLIAIIGIVVTYDFDFSFAFHRPGSGYTMLGDQMYANNGTDNTLDPVFVQPEQNGTINFANPTATVPQPINGTQNLTSSSPSDIFSHLNLARQAVELGNPNAILKELGFVEQQLYSITKNTTSSDFSTMSNLSSTELNATKNQPEDIEDKVPVEEQRPRSSSSHEEPPQRTRSYQ